jgi:tRNA pseudouridine65 synthase
MSNIEIIYRDDSTVAVNKPAGLAVHRGWARGERFAMTELRDLLGQWVYPVHRLDQAASGVLLFGLSSEAARALCQRFERHEVEKHYVALVRGSPPDALAIEHALRPDNGGAPQAAHTDVRRIAQWGRYAWLEARPVTGRLHQIRRHLKHVSCPIIGDVRYGKGEHNRLFRERYGLHRLALHAAGLTIAGLNDGQRLELAAPLPGDLQRVLDQLEREAVGGDSGSRE